MKKILSCLLCTLMLFSYVTVPATAANDGIMPCYNNVISTRTQFNISDSGVARVTVSYEGVPGVTTGATITTKIQKRSLGLIWTKVDIGTTNNEWVDSTRVESYSTFHSVTLPDTGTYRVVVEYEITGTGGATDVIEDIQTAEY